MSQFPLSIVVPTYNSIEKMSETLASLHEASQLTGCEVIFVDDCSSDDTYNKLAEISSAEHNWQVHRLPSNSGSAAAPRNHGIELSQGKYVFFLDSDDIVEPVALADALSHAEKYDFDIVRSALYVRSGDGTVSVSDKIRGWDKIGSNTVSRIRAITRHQSLTCSFLMKRALLEAHSIQFDPGRRIGEDIKFTAEVLANVDSIGFRNRPIRTYVKASAGNESVTQRITSSQFADFVRSWSDVESALAAREVSFVKEHGFAAIQYALRQYVWFGTESLRPDVFDAFSQFCRDHWTHISGFDFAPRIRELIDAAYAGNYEEFKEASQLRLVIAGHDLKFLNAMLPRFQAEFAVKIDQWQGHTAHNDQQSRDLVAWGDLFWAEWLLGAAVWYSKNLRSDQRLIVRAHRSEMVAGYGLQVNWKRVSAVVAIGTTALADFSDRFDIPRNLFWLIPNAIDVDAYSVGTSPERLHHIGMIGIAPRLKRFDLAIRAIAALRESDPAAKLHIYGKHPHDLPWLMRISEEAQYYQDCESLIQELGVANHIEYHGWVDTRKEIANLGAVVSFSDFEGLQVSIAEAYCGGAVGLTRNWRGAKQGYPREAVFDSPEDLVNRLKELLRSPADHAKLVDAGRDLVQSMNDVDAVWDRTIHMIRSIRA